MCEIGKCITPGIPKLCVCGVDDIYMMSLPGVGKQIVQVVDKDSYSNYA